MTETNPRDPGNLCPPDVWPEVPTEYPVPMMGTTPKLMEEMKRRGWTPPEPPVDA